jgi:hypothetical protein
MAEGTIPMEVFAKSAHSSAKRVPGTAIFMASTSTGVPSALLHNIKHNKVLHERVVDPDRGDPGRALHRRGKALRGEGPWQGLLPPDPALRLP